MRYAIFTDIHANLEALEAVLAKIDNLAQEEPIDQIWFLGDLVGYGPNPNECIDKLRTRTDVIIAGNHDWAAVGKISLEDFSDAARISAEWTAKQLTEEHRQFLTDLPERITREECVLVHGSPYGPLWEYLTTEILAERSFQYFHTRFCFVGHTHVPVIFIQPENMHNTPTIPLGEADQNGTDPTSSQETEEGFEIDLSEIDLIDENETGRIVSILPLAQGARATLQDEHAHSETEALQTIAQISDMVSEAQQKNADEVLDAETASLAPAEEVDSEEAIDTEAPPESIAEPAETEETDPDEDSAGVDEVEGAAQKDNITPEEAIQNAEESLNEEIEELLALLGLSQSMINVTNEMLAPPEGEWQAPAKHRAIINPGGVGQPRDGNPHAAFMIYDTEGGFTFYRVPYPFEKTQEKIIKAGLPQSLAIRLAYGR